MGFARDGYCPATVSLDADRDHMEVKLHPCADRMRGVPAENLRWPRKDARKPSDSWFCTVGYDMQGELPDGRRWRYVGARSSATSYDPVYPEAADFFDALLETL